MKDIFFAICTVSFVPSVLFSVYMMLVPATEKFTNAKWQFSTLKYIMVLFMIPVYSIVNRLASCLGDYFTIQLPNIFIELTSANGLQAVVPSDFNAIGVAEKASSIQSDFFGVVSILWIVGIVSIFVYQVYSYRELFKKIKAITPATDIQSIVSGQKEKLGITDNVTVFYDKYTDTPMLSVFPNLKYCYLV